MIRGVKILVLITVLFSSCVSKKITRFQYDMIDQSMVSNDYKTIFKPDDLLQITVSAKDLKSVAPFNLPAVNLSATTGLAVAQPRQQAYLVDSNGEIDFPILGKVKVGGLTREEVIQDFIDRLNLVM